MKIALIFIITVLITGVIGLLVGSKVAHSYTAGVFKEGAVSDQREYTPTANPDYVCVIINVYNGGGISCFPKKKEAAQ